MKALLHHGTVDLEWQLLQFIHLLSVLQIRFTTNY